MLKYIFILTMWTTGGDQHVLVAGENLSGESCIKAIENYVVTTPDLIFGTPSCEIDYAIHTDMGHASLSAEFVHKGQTLVLPPCQYEDSRNCYWDAGERGTGHGASFYDVHGVTYYFHP